MKKNDAIRGFAIKDIRPLAELSGQVWEMEHKKSGARLVWLDRADENKTFGIAFRTTPKDEIGRAHV